MINCVIIDDEPNSIYNLSFALKDFQDINIANTYTDPMKAIGFLKTEDIDLVFLDIEMPEMDGFQILKELKHLKFEVVITTAYNNYAIKAFRYNAIDYLLKPIDKEDLLLTIKRARTKIKNNEHNIEHIITSINQITNPKKIIIKNKGELLFFETDEISYVISDGNYSKIYLTNKDTLFITKKIKEIDKLLPKPIFLRVHNSYIINIQKIKSFLVSENYVILDSKEKIPISKTYKNNLLEHL